MQRDPTAALAGETARARQRRACSQRSLAARLTENSVSASSSGNSCSSVARLGTCWMFFASVSRAMQASGGAPVGCAAMHCAAYRWRQLPPVWSPATASPLQAPVRGRRLCSRPTADGPPSACCRRLPPPAAACRRRRLELPGYRRSGPVAWPTCAELVKSWRGFGGKRGARAVPTREQRTGCCSGTLNIGRRSEPASAGCTIEGKGDARDGVDWLAAHAAPLSARPAFSRYRKLLFCVRKVTATHMTA